MAKNPKIHNGHFERTRKRLLTMDVGDLAEVDVLEGLLQLVFLRADTNEIARNMLFKYRNLSTLSKISVKELMDIDGVGEVAAKKIAVLFKSIEYIKLAQTRIMYETPTNTSNAHDLISKYFEKSNKECLQAFYLDNGYNLLHSTIISVGTINDVAMNYSLICEQSQRYGASRVIIAHNHPSGNPMPSIEDFNCTSRLYGMLRSIDIRLVDHLILGANSNYFSFAAAKILPYIADLFEQMLNRLYVPIARKG